MTPPHPHPSTWRALRAMVLLCVPLVLSCSEGASPAAKTGPGCDTSLRPIVFVHGYLASSDTWAEHAQRFAANGYCPDRLVALDWDSVGGETDPSGLLLGVVDEVLQRTGADRVDLAGHSAGGALSLAFLSDPARAGKVAHYAHVAARTTGEDGAALSAPSGVPTLNLYSAADAAVPAGTLDGATNKDLKDQDHFEVATSPESFAAIYRHFRDGQSATTETPTATAKPVLAGKALFFGHNDPATGWTVEVYRVDAATGQRTSAAATFDVSSDGAWGPFAAAPEARYELVLVSPDGTGRRVHHYIEPVVADRRHLVLRSLPGPTTLVGALLAGLPATGDGVTVVYSTSRAVVFGRDQLSVDGRELASPLLSPPERTAIAYFLFDAGADGKPGGEAQLFGAAAPMFVLGVDAVLPAKGTADITLNGRSLKVPNRPASEGVNIVMLEVGDTPSGEVKPDILRCDPIAQDCSFPEVPECEVVFGPGTAATPTVVDGFRCGPSRGADKLGEPCTRPDGAGKDSCAKGLYCAFNGTPQGTPQVRTCLAMCNATSPTCADPERACFGFDAEGKLGVCALTCEPFAKGCPTGTKCGLYPDTVTAKPLMWLCDFDGEGGDGAACSNSRICQDGHACIHEADGQRRCRALCHAGLACSGGATCTSLDVSGPTGIGYCSP